MRCNKCGKQLPDGTESCPVCGAPTGVAATPAPPVINDPPKPPVQPPQPAGGGRCPKCGKALPDGESSCPVCGTATGEVTGTVTPPPIVVDDGRDDNIPETSGGGKKKLGIALTAAAAVAVVVGIAIANRPDRSAIEYSAPYDTGQQTEAADNAAPEGDAPQIRSDGGGSSNNKKETAKTAEQGGGPNIRDDRDDGGSPDDGEAAQTSAPKQETTDTPALVKTIVSWGTSWIDGFEMYESYRDKYGFDQNVIWFQDVTGDGEPEMIVGGYGMYIGQGESRIFEIYNKNGALASGNDVTTMWTSSSSHGHDAFTLQAYKDSSGSLFFADGAQMEFTSTNDGSAAYYLYKYSFGSSCTKDELLSFSYYKDENRFDSCKYKGSSVDAAKLKSSYNDFFSSATPLKASFKTVKLSDYKSMSDSERTEALTRSYNAAGYTSDSSSPPLSSLTDKISSAGSEGRSSDGGASAKDSYDTALSKKLSQLSSGEYFLNDLDGNGQKELIYRSGSSGTYSAVVV